MQPARSWLSKGLALLFVACLISAGLPVARAQPGPAKKIGVVWSGTSAGTAPYWGAFVEEMRGLGWIDGKTARFMMRFDDDQKSLLPKLAAELVALRVDVLVVTSVAAPAARGATTTVPIVVCDAYDAVAEGLTLSLARPKGNLTGASGQSGETAFKRVELARELMPHLQRVALLTDPGDTGARIDAQGVEAAARHLGLEIRTFEVRHSRDFPAAFATIKRYRPDVLMVPVSTLTADNLTKIIDFASSSRLPTFSELSAFAEAGMLLTYGINYRDLVQIAAIQVDKILRGAKPAELPWEQPTKFELMVNTRTAKALGLRVPESIMLRATRIIR
jgi:putative ABC transport system substrate-binding protein